MGYIDFDGNTVDLSVHVSSDLFKIAPILLPKNEKFEFPGDGLYALNPWSNIGSVTDNNRVFYGIKLYDENKNVIFSSSSNYQSYVYRIDGLNVYCDMLRDWGAYTEGIFNPTTLVGTLSEIPHYMSYGVTGDSGADISNKKMTYTIVSKETPSSDVNIVKYDTTDKIGLLEQFDDFSNNSYIEVLDTEDEPARRIRSEMIRVLNHMRGAIRIGSYNIARNGQAHWYKIKRCLQNYGIDICGMQEVQYPNGDSSSYPKKLSTYFSSWEFDSFSDNGKVGEFPNNGNYPNNVRCLMTGNGFKVDSTQETYFATQTASSTGDHRYVAKSVVSMPRYKDKRGSENLKMSVYNTQLEVNSANTAQAQAREILAMAQADENPFVIIMGDTNDFTLTKEVWKIFDEGGFTPIVNTNTATVSGTWDYNCIDNFFVSSRIKPLDFDVIWSQLYPWSNNQAIVTQLSDHDLVIADVQLDYSDIRCINLNTSSPYFTSSYTKGWMTDKETVTITLTPATGRTITAITAKDCQMTNNEAIVIDGNTITLDGTKLVGDVYIGVTTQEDS